MCRSSRLIALLLCISILMSIAGCAGDPAPTATTEGPGPSTQSTTAPTVKPTETNPTEPDNQALTVFNAAAQQLSEASNVKRTITLTETMEVNGESIETEWKQDATYLGIGTEDFAASVTDNLSFNGYWTEIHEIFTGGTAYATLLDTNFSSEMAAEEYTERNLPINLIDPALYGSVTAEQKKDLTQIHFTEPTALESWVHPAGELIEAEATATVNTDGAIAAFSYTAKYRVLGATVTSEVLVKMKNEEEMAPISAPTDADSYTSVEYLDGPRLLEQAYGFIMNAKNITLRSSETAVVQAAAIYASNSFTLDRALDDGKFICKVDANYSAVEQATGQTYESSMVETFIDGKYSMTLDDSRPQYDNSVTQDVMVSYIEGMMETLILNCCYLLSSDYKDLGGLALIEFACDEEYALYLKDYATGITLAEPGILDSLGTYRTKSTRLYIAFDKYLGLPTAMGISYEGIHNIEGVDYSLTYQQDQAIHVGSTSAYESILDTHPALEAPETPATPLFYHVTGADGQEMWLLGTIHVGDNRTTYLPDEIWSSLGSSDALALECNIRAFDEQVEKDPELQADVSAAYYYANGAMTKDHISDKELYEDALLYMKATGNYNINTPYLKAAVWSSSIENFYLQQSCSLISGQGVDNQLQNWAEDHSIPIWEVESSLFQLQMSTGWSQALSELLLEDALADSAYSYYQSVTEMYELWCSGDEAALIEMVKEDTSDLTEEELKLWNEYNTAMSTDRNAGMIDKAIEYLEGGSTVFYAVGLAHVLAEDGLVNGLRDAGYTVEIVKYQ